MSNQQKLPPWYDKVTGGGHQGLIISEHDGTTIALTYEPEDAPFIVRACNAHDDLVATLQDMLSGWRYIREVHGDLPGVGWDRAENAARAALAKAQS